MPGIDILDLLNKSEELNDLSAVVVTEIESCDLTLLRLVELLGPWLTDPEKEKRKQGTALLAGVLKLLSCNFLTEKECLFMVSFFCDRLRDHYTVIPYALSGLAALSAMDNFSDESPKEIIAALQENITCQALTQPQRNSFYSIMKNVLATKSELISTNLPSEYMYALISGMDSESDPRNLLLLFSFVPKAFSEIPIKHLAEEAFAVLECYFPVDFTPVEEKGNITREDLARGLEACFVTNPAFAEYCIPMICDKLESTLKVAQLDSLRLIINGFKNWNIESVNSLLKRLWFSIKDVLIPGNDQEVALLAKDALVAILTAYSRAPLSEDETKSLNFLLDNVLSSTYSYLSNPSLSLFLPTLRLLSDVIAVSYTTAGFILPRILPQLIALLETECEQKDLLLKAFAPILMSAVKFNVWESGGPCEDCLRKILPIVLKSIEDEKCSGSAFACLTSLISKLSDDIRLSLYTSMLKIIYSKSFPSNRQEFAVFIRTLCEEYPVEVEKHLISAFRIPEELNDIQARNYLELLTWTIDFPYLTQSVAAVILNHIIMSELAVWRSDAVYVLRNYIINADIKTLVCLGAECGFPQKLLVSYFNCTEKKQDEVESVADILTRIVRVLDAGLQKSILTTGLELFHMDIPIDEHSSDQLVLLEGLMCGLQRQVDIPNSLQLSEFLIDCSISAKDTVVSAPRLLAVFINKMNNDNDLDRVLKLAKLKIQTSPGTSSVILSAWITKSLILRGFSPVCDDWLVGLLSLVSSPEYGITAAEGVHLLLEESLFLSEANHCNIGLLYRQRVFQKVNILIPDDGKPSKSESLALAYILKFSPTALVLGIVGQLTGVMVHCLKSDESSVVLAILGILSNLLESCVDILRTFAETFIAECILLAQTSPYMMVRKDALHCLYLYGKYNSVDMLPYKNMVLSGLQKCLDDKKRHVRQCAVKARTRWFLI